MGNPNRNQLLSELRAFAIELKNSADQPREKTNPFIPSHMFSMAEHGGLALSGEETSRYSRILDGLSQHMGEAMSEASIQTLVQTAILKTLDLRERNGAEPVAVRAAKAVDEVKAALGSPRLKWVSCVPILGISPPKKAWTSLGT